MQHLPEELIVEILSRLSVKSLMRFKCVSKSWKSLLSDPQFVNLHLHRSSAKSADFTHIRFLLSFSIDESSGLISATSCSLSSLLEGPSFSSASKSYTYDNGVCRYQCIGTCNGLISFSRFDFEYYYVNKRYCYDVHIWNPATRLSQKSPPLYSTNRECANFGFGYDWSSDTYKAVAVQMSSAVNVVQVYNIGGTCWRRIQDFPPHLFSRRDGVYVNGTLNWIAILRDSVYGKNGSDLNTCQRRLTIVSLDLTREKNTELSLPSSCLHPLCIVLGVLKGCLCLSQNDRNRQFTVWQMKEFGVHESWTQLWNIIGYEDILKRPCIPLCISDNDNVLLVSNVAGSRNVLYNLRDKILERTNIDCNTINSYSKNYIESLISPC